MLTLLEPLHIEGHGNNSELEEGVSGKLVVSVLKKKEPIWLKTTREENHILTITDNKELEKQWSTWKL